MHSKEVFELDTRDVFVRETGGGGGFGDPLERDTGLVLNDVLDRKVSEKSARDDYGVVLLDDGFAVDETATVSPRTEMAATRGPVA